MILRPYQADMDSGINAAFREHRRVLAQLPTGGGKTVLFTHQAATTEGRVAIVAHRRELIRQAHQKCLEAGVDATIYPSAQPGRVTVGSIQTLSRRLDHLPRFAKIILDEAHHAVANQYAALIESQPDALVLGVTATPERLDGRGLGTVFGSMVCGPSAAWLTERGFLVPVRVYGPPAPVDLSGVRTTAGDYNSADLERVMARPTLLGSAPEHYERLASGRRALVFCVSVKHAEESAAAFRAEGWKFVAVSGGMSTEDRDRVFADFASGRIQGLTSCELISEGLDIPDVGCVILQRPTQSLGMYLQMVGRGMRPAPGKADCIVLDHAGNCLRHHLPAADRMWSLDAPRRAKAREVAVMQCPECFAHHAPGPVCPECGHDYREAAAEAEQRRIEVEAGELALMTEEDKRLKELRETPLRELLKRARSHADFEEIETARGYDAGWANIQARLRLGRARLVATDGAEFVG